MCVCVWLEKAIGALDQTGSRHQNLPWSISAPQPST